MRRKSLKDIAYAVVRNEVVVVVLPPSPYSLVVVPVSRSILSFPRPSVIPINHQLAFVTRIVVTKSQEKTQLHFSCNNTTFLYFFFF